MERNDVMTFGDLQDYIEASREQPKEYNLPNEELDTGFKVKYPPDPVLGTEADDDARVWKVYRDEAMANDGLMLDGWNKTLDILLIFAALFSAVVTTFVVESTSLLQPDSAAYAANALFAIANISGASYLPPPPEYDTSVSGLSCWVNRLWYTSLAFSLFVAILCILAKQWITEYTARNNASFQNPRHWARRHQLYFQAMKHWRVADFISVMPLMLHFALFLFFAGLAVSLWPSDRGTATWLTTLATLLFMFYLVATFLPLYTPERPTATPLVNQARRCINAVHLATLHSCVALCDGVEDLWAHLYRIRHRWVHVVCRLGASLHVTSRIRRRIEATRTNPTEKDLIDRRLEQHSAKLDADALIWIILHVSDSDAVAVGWQAIGSWQPGCISAEELRNELCYSFSAKNAATRTLSTLNTTEVVRIVRTALSLNVFGISRSALRSSVAELTWELYQGGDHPDMDLVDLVLRGAEADNIAGVSEKLDLSRFPSLPSTAKLLLCINDLNMEEQASILLSCDLRTFTDADWRLAMRQRATSCSNVHTRSISCSVYCLVDITARLLSGDPDSSPPNQWVLRLLDRLIPCIPSTPASNLYDWSSLVTYMASERFIESPREVPVARSYIRALQASSAMSVYAVMLDDRLLTDYLRALTMGVYACMPHLAEGAYCVCQIAFGACGVVKNHAGENDNLGLGLELVLCRAVSDSRTITLWEMIANGANNAPFGLSLMVTLASALRIHSQRGNDTTAFTNRFLGAIHIPILLRGLERSWRRNVTEVTERRINNVRKKNLAYLSETVHHLKELRPSWWAECIAYAESSEVEPTLRHCTTAIDALVQEAGDCPTCRQRL